MKKILLEVSLIGGPTTPEKLTKDMFRAIEEHLMQHPFVDQVNHQRQNYWCHACSDGTVCHSNTTGYCKKNNPDAKWEETTEQDQKDARDFIRNECIRGDLDSIATSLDKISETLEKIALAQDALARAVDPHYNGKNSEEND